MLKIRDYSRFFEERFASDLLQIRWDSILSNQKTNVDKLFSRFLTKLNKLVNKHVPLVLLSKRKAKQFSEPWICNGLLKSITVKNAFFVSDDGDKYKLYRNKLATILLGTVRNCITMHIIVIT